MPYELCPFVIIPIADIDCNVILALSLFVNQSATNSSKLITQLDTKNIESDAFQVKSFI